MRLLQSVGSMLRTRVIKIKYLRLRAKNGDQDLSPNPKFCIAELLVLHTELSAIPICYITYARGQNDFLNHNESSPRILSWSLTIRGCRVEERYRSANRSDLSKEVDLRIRPIALIFRSKPRSRGLSADRSDPQIWPGLRRDQADRSDLLTSSHASSE